jgi:hypothetical protein
MNIEYETSSKKETQTNLFRTITSLKHNAQITG